MDSVEEIVNKLKDQAEGTVYITPDGTKLFMMLGTEQVMCATSLTRNFNEMTDEEIKSFIMKLVGA